MVWFQEREERNLKGENRMRVMKERKIERTRGSDVEDKTRDLGGRRKSAEARENER